MTALGRPFAWVGCRLAADVASVLVLSMTTSANAGKRSAERMKNAVRVCARSALAWVELASYMDLIDKVLVAFVSTPGAILVPLVAIVIAGMLFHFNSQMTFAVFI